MCFELDSEPPVPAVKGAAVAHDDLVLEAADGNRFAAFRASPEDTSLNVGVVILPDVRGLYRFYEELALRFAERGYHALAIDYFGRTAGIDKRGDDFDYMEHVNKTTGEGIQADVRAAVEHTHEDGYHAVFTVGFCFGGRHSWLAAAAGHGLAGAVGFDGNPAERGDEPGPLKRAADFQCPILALQAGEDVHITPELNALFEEALDNAGVEYELTVYEGAPHSFFDRRYEEFADASADAWARTLAFIDRHA